MKGKFLEFWFITICSKSNLCFNTKL